VKIIYQIVLATLMLFGQGKLGIEGLSLAWLKNTYILVFFKKFMPHMKQK